MSSVRMRPCETAIIQSTVVSTNCPAGAKPWVLLATILASSIVYIDESVVNVALPAPGALSPPPRRSRRSVRQTQAFHSGDYHLCRCVAVVWARPYHSAINFSSCDSRSWCRSPRSLLSCPDRCQFQRSGAWEGNRHMGWFIGGRDSDSSVARRMDR